MMNPGIFGSVLGMRVGPLDFGEPVWLFALLVLIPIVYLWRTSRVPGTPLRRWVGLILRCALALALVLSLAGTRLVWHSNGICVVFVLDQSQSVPGAAREAARSAIETQVQKMRKDDRFVVVEFGGDAVLGSLPSAKGPMPPNAQVADSGHTDIARALRLGMASFPPDRQKRIVLFSDGNQNVGDALKEARIAAAQDVDVDVVLLAAAQGHEVMVEQVVVPTHVRKDANFAVRAIISSDIPQTVRLNVTRDGVHMPIQNDRVTLKAGTNVIDIPDSLSTGGYHNYAVTVDEAIDTFAANNTGYAFTTVDAPSKILVIRGKPDTEDYLSRALKASGLDVQTMPSNMIPATARDFASYDCVILDDVNAGIKNFSPTQMKELERWVTDFGGGLVLIGGDDSFGPGDYASTPLETVSPVSMDIKRKESLASLAIVIVNDKSGSMGAPVSGAVGKEKMDLANEGSIKLVQTLDTRDYAMIGAVDTEVKWMDSGGHLLQMTDLNKAKLASNTRSVRAGGGGIYCSTALYAAYQLLNSSHINAMSKHVIMFADACDAEEQIGCVTMARTNYNLHGVTTSCIGMGKEGDPDVPFLKEVAGNPRGTGGSGNSNGHGRFYLTDDVRDLPRLFAKEAFIINKKPYVENPKGIVMTRYNSPLLQGFEGLPKIYGYVGTTLKPRATLALHGEKADDPVLAHWVIGLGKCVAYTSDSTSKWGKDFVASPVYEKFWAQVVRWVSRSQGNNGLTTNTVIEGSSGTVTVEAQDEAGRPINNMAGMKAKVLRPNSDSGSEDVDLEQVGPGRYQGRFAASERGTYLLTVYEGETHQPLSTGGGVLSYPPEYRDLRANAPLLHAIAETSGGKFLESVDNVFEEKPVPVRTYWPLWQALLIFLAVTLLLDVAWRRLNVAEWFRRPSFRGMPVLTGGGAGENLRAYRSIKAARKDVQTQQETLRERVESLAESMPAAGVHPAVPRTVEPTAAEVAGAEKKTGASGPQAEGYANRLMGAKKRAEQQIKEQSKPNDK